MDGLILLNRAREAGLVVAAEGDKLLIRGPRRADSVARLLIEHQPEVPAALAPDVDGANYRQPVIDPTWQKRYSARIVHWFLHGHRRWHEAEAIAYSELLMEWHKRRSALADPRRCAGCGDKLSDDAGLTLCGGFRIHFGGIRGADCVILYGRKWRIVALTAALHELGLDPPREFTLL